MLIFKKNPEYFLPSDFEFYTDLVVAKNTNNFQKVFKTLLATSISNYLNYVETLTLPPRSLFMTTILLEALPVLDPDEIKQQLSIFSLELFNKLYIPREYCSYEHSYRRVFDGHLGLKMYNYIYKAVESPLEGISFVDSVEYDLDSGIDIQSVNNRILHITIEENESIYALSKWCNKHPQNLKRDKKELWQLLNKNY